MRLWGDIDHDIHIFDMECATQLLIYGSGTFNDYVNEVYLFAQENPDYEINYSKLLDEPFRFPAPPDEEIEDFPVPPIKDDGEIDLPDDPDDEEPDFDFTDKDEKGDENDGRDEGDPDGDTDFDFVFSNIPNQHDLGIKPLADLTEDDEVDFDFDKYPDGGKPKDDEDSDEDEPNEDPENPSEDDPESGPQEEEPPIEDTEEEEPEFPVLKTDWSISAIYKYDEEDGISGFLWVQERKKNNTWPSYITLKYFEDLETLIRKVDPLLNADIVFETLGEYLITGSENQEEESSCAHCCQNCHCRRD